MTEEQKSHARDIAEEFMDAMFYKYEKGAKEHGGNIWDKEPDWLLDQAIDEAIDQVVYLMTLRQKLYGE